MSSLHMSLAGVDALARGFEQAPELTQRTLLATMTQATMLVEREAKDAMPKVTGMTAGSIASDAFSTPVGVMGVVGSSQPSATFVELGTKPHWIGKENRVALEAWVRAKLGVSAKDAPGVAYLVARKIARKGTKAQHPLQKVATANEGQVLRMFEDAAGRVAAYLVGAPGGAS